MLSTSPRQQVTLTLKRLRPFSLLVNFQRADKSELDLTGAQLRLVISAPARRGGAVLVTSSATLVDAVGGLARFDIQADDLSMAAGQYVLAATLRSVEGYEATVFEGEVTVEHNPDPVVPLDYSTVTPPLGLTVVMQSANKLSVRVNHIPDALLQSYSQQATDSAVSAEIFANRAAAEADAAAASALEANAAIQTAHDAGVTGAQSAISPGVAEATAQANRAAAEADAAAASATQAASGTATQMAAVDADATSAFRTQQDARLQSRLDELVGAAPAQLDTLNELSAALGNDPNFSSTMTAQLATKAPLDSPALTGNPTAPTPATSDNDTSLATTEFVKAALLAAHPVGDIKFTTTNVNPGTYLGGTWVAWGSGRVPVGVDTAQTEFNTVEKPGGAKTHLLTAAESGVPGHTHTGSTGGRSASHSHTFPAYAFTNSFGWTDTGGLYMFALLQAGATGPVNSPIDNAEHTHSFTTSANAAANASAAHNNLQPFITCYMWKRTA